MVEPAHRQGSSSFPRYKKIMVKTNNIAVLISCLLILNVLLDGTNFIMAGGNK